MQAKPVYKCGVMIVFGLLVIACGCAHCHYPKGHTPQLSRTSSPTPAVTIVAYGDTRTGPWGLGDNAKQALHGKVVDDILANDGHIDAVIFTGDAVMTNFVLWKKDYWRCFLSQSNRFRKAKIPFYPSLGNHEVMSPVVPLIQTTALSSSPAGNQILLEQDAATRIAAAYDAGESAAAKPRPAAAAVFETVEPSTKKGQAALKQWERGIATGDAASANQFGQFEGHLQASFYALSAAKDERCSVDAQTFSDNYLKQAKYNYLRPLLQGKSYYSVTVENAGIRVKLIALDTNCLDSLAQQAFFAKEVKSFEGPIIVFGHHPPVDYTKTGGPWDLVPGWGHRDDEEMKRYISTPEGKQIVLWVFGHVHDYQRRGPSGVEQRAIAPVLLIAGGGGASPPDAAPADFQWQPLSWPQPSSKAAFNQVKITVTATNIAVDVRTAENGAAEFTSTDSFLIPLDASTHP